MFEILLWVKCIYRLKYSICRYSQYGIMIDNDRKNVDNDNGHLFYWKINWKFLISVDWSAKNMMQAYTPLYCKKTTTSFENIYIIFNVWNS